MTFDQEYETAQAETAEVPETGGIPDVYQLPFRLAMPLLNSYFSIGHVMEFIDGMPDADDRQIALAEYLLFSGRAEECARTAELYLTSHDPSLRFSASLLCTFANLGRGHSNMAHFAMKILRQQMEVGFRSKTPIQFHSIGVFTANAAAVLLHMPTENIPPLDEYLAYLPGGMKLYACYILAHKAYLSQDYAKCLTIADIGLALCPQHYPIAEIYTHLAAAMALINMRRTEEALVHMDKAWKIAEPDGLLQPFGEHHGLLQGLVEVYFKKNAPNVLPRIIEITYAFSAGWRALHNSETNRTVADNLTTTEFSIAMLYNRGWSAKEIAAHMGFSPRTVSNIVQVIYQKLGISRKGELGRFMLY